MSAFRTLGTLVGCLAIVGSAAMLVANHGSAADAPQQAPAHLPDTPQPRILEIDPDSIEVTGHDVRLHVTYVINHVDQVEGATLLVQSYPPGRSQEFPIDVVEEGTAEVVFRALGTPIDRWLTEASPPGFAGVGQQRGIDVSIQTKSASDPGRPYGEDNVAVFGDMKRVLITDRRVYRSPRS